MVGREGHAGPDVPISAVYRLDPPCCKEREYQYLCLLDSLHFLINNGIFVKSCAVKGLQIYM